MSEMAGEQVMYANHVNCTTASSMQMHTKRAPIVTRRTLEETMSAASDTGYVSRADDHFWNSTWAGESGVAGLDTMGEGMASSDTLCTPEPS